MIRINVSGVSANVTAKEILTAGRVGLECEFTFDGEWDGLFKTAVFQGIETIEVALPSAVCTVPYEALAVEGVQLKIGVYGANGAGTVVIPTVWVNAGKILPSAGAVPPDTPTQTVNAYAVEKAEQAYNIAVGVQQKAENGDFDGAPGPQGEPGATGADGFSPSAEVVMVGDRATITITDKDGTTTAHIRNGADGLDGAPGATGPQGPAGPGVPAGGTTGQVLKKVSGTNYDTEWADESGGGSTIEPYTSTPAALGTASAGSSDKYARGDHVHKKPTAAELGVVSTTQGIANVDKVLMVQDTGKVGLTDIPTKYAQPANQFPQNLGISAPGTSTYYSRADHRHAMPSAADVGAEPATTEVTISTAGAVTQALDAGKIYHFTGALTALTITLNTPASGQIAHYHFDFDCGSTAPTVTIPNTVTMPDSNSIEANKHYEVDILNNYGAVISWANS